MTADLFVLRDFVERGFRTFDIAYRYTSGEVMEAEIPPTYQPLFGNQKSLKLCFSDAALIDPSIERVAHGALVLDALGRLLEGNRNTIGHALIARKISFPDSPPSYKDRLHVLNARVTHTASTLVYRPIIRLEFRVRVIGQADIRSQNVPVFYDLETGRVLDGSRYADLNLLDVEETNLGHENVGLKTPPGDVLSSAAEAAASHLKRQLTGLEPGPEGEHPVVGLHLTRMLVLHDPRAGLLIRFKERSTRQEFSLAFSVGEDQNRIAAPFCPQCGRIKTHYYISHQTGQLICTDCSLLCVGCWDAYSLEGRNCDLCEKRRYCPRCLRECGTCAMLGCPDHTREDPKTGRVYCVDCASPAEEHATDISDIPDIPEKDAPLLDVVVPPATTNRPPSAKLIGSSATTDPSASTAGSATPTKPTTPRQFGHAGHEDNREPPALRSSRASRPPDHLQNGKNEDIFDTTADVGGATPLESSPPTANVPEDGPAGDGDDDLFALDDDMALAPPSVGNHVEDEDDIFALSNDRAPTEPDTGHRTFDAVFLEDSSNEELFHDDPDDNNPDDNDPDDEGDSTGFEPASGSGDLHIPLSGTDKEDERERADATTLDVDVLDEEDGLIANAPDTTQTDDPAGEPSRTVQCACHGQPAPVTDLRMDFLSGRYYCPEQVQPCDNCGQATALDFLDGDPPLCFYCSNRMPLNLDPEGEEIFRREIQPLLSFKYRLASCQIARSPHHLAFYIKPLVGREVILYWDRWTDALLDDDQL